MMLMLSCTTYHDGRFFPTNVQYYLKAYYLQERLGLGQNIYIIH